MRFERPLAFPQQFIVRPWFSAIRNIRISLNRSAVLAAAVVGLGYAFLMPPLNVPDETSHFLRAYRLTQGHFIPEVHAVIPGALIDLLSQFDEETTQERDRYVPNLRRLVADRPADESSPVDADGYRTTDFYDSLTYVPQAIGIGIARLFHASAVVMTYAGRISNFAVFLIIVAFALRVTPVFRLGFIAALFIPMVLHQAASNSADSFAIAIAFLFTALVFRAAYAAPEFLLKRTEILGLLACALGLGIAKADFILVALVALIRPKSVGGLIKYVSLICGSVIMCSLPPLLWRFAAGDYLARANQLLTTTGFSDPDANLSFLEHNLLLCLQGIANATMAFGGQYLETAIGRFGPLVVYLPAWVVVLNVIVLIFIGVTQKRPAAFGLYDRLISLGVCAIYILAVMLATFIATTDLFDLVAHIALGHGEFGGMQGRYLLPIVPLAIPLLCTKREIFSEYIRISVLGACILITTIASYNSIFRFYITYSFLGPHHCLIRPHITRGALSRSTTPIRMLRTLGVSTTFTMGAATGSCTQIGFQEMALHHHQRYCWFLLVQPRAFVGWAQIRS